MFVVLFSSVIRISGLSENMHTYCTINTVQ